MLMQLDKTCAKWLRYERVSAALDLTFYVQRNVSMKSECHEGRNSDTLAEGTQIPRDYYWGEHP
jgi:hypothetical protein